MVMFLEDFALLFQIVHIFTFHFQFSTTQIIFLSLCFPRECRPQPASVETSGMQ